MDDVPPGPTGQGPRRQTLTVVIPVFNGGNDLKRCLRGLRNSAGTDYELIVVDDGSTDDSATVAAEFGAKVLQVGTSQGPALARNSGAKAASGDIIFFLDADVEVHPNTLNQAIQRFEADPTLGALFGSYDDEPAVGGLVSPFRNLLHHFVHQQGDFRDNIRPARTFWTGCGAIRRRIFLESGGFDPSLYRRPAIEDIELGYRLADQGHRIILARDILGKHLKRWTLRSMILTDIFQRGIPWIILMKRSEVAETDLNVRPSQKICVIATGVAVLGLIGSLFDLRGLGLVALSVATVTALNAPFYRFLARKRGVLFALGAIPLHLVYYGCCAASVILAEAIWRLDRQRSRTGQSSTILAGPHGARRAVKTRETTAKKPR